MNITALAISFWICFFIVFYTYIGYGFVIYILNRFKSKEVYEIPLDLPEITLVVPCYNEEQIIEQKIKNSFSLNYPKEKLKYIFITDGSTDRTNEIISQYPQIQLLFINQRKGKSAAENRVIPFVTSEITVFCDANAMFNTDALLHLAKYFTNKKVGGVSGEKRFVLEENDGVIKSEGLYWKYESFLKQQDAQYYTVVGAAGEMFAIRTALYETMPDDTINDDLTQSLAISLKGYRIAYSNESYAMERPSDNISEEKKRKIRMIAGAWQTMSRLPQAINPFHDFKLAFQFISHRVLRWTLCPLALVGLILINIMLVNRHEIPLLYEPILLLQIFFYSLAFVGYRMRNKATNFKLTNFSYYFVFMNYCTFLGFYRFMKGQQTPTWDKAQRKI